MVSAIHADSSGAITSVGFSPTVTGSATGVDITLSLAGTNVQRYSRLVRKVSGNWSGVTVSTRYINSVRGFTCRFLFGTVAYDAATALFAGLRHTDPAAGFTTFPGWASVYALGVYKANAGNGLSWAYRTDAGTTSEVSTGLTWTNGEVYTLELSCPAVGASVSATLSNTAGDSASYTFTTFPDANTNPAALLAPAVIVGTGSTTTQLAVHSLDCVEPW
jgi:hypothetical protein